MTAARLAAAALVLGSALMIFFDGTLPRVAGVLSVLAFVALGAFAIATPRFLESDGEESREPSRRSST